VSANKIVATASGFALTMATIDGYSRLASRFELHSGKKENLAFDSNLNIIMMQNGG
jgi:hypothetical protein